MRSLLTVLSASSLASVLLPGVALACGGDEGTYYEHYGTAAFTPAGEITAISPNHDDIYDWVAIDAQSQRLGRGTIDVMPAMESSGPRIRLGEGHVFALVGGQLFRVSESSSVREPVLGGVYGYDLVADASSMLMVTGGASDTGTTHLTIRRENRLAPRTKLMPVATADSTCDVFKLAIGRFPNGDVAGLCGDAPFRLDGDVLTIEPSLGIGHIDAVETAGFDESGALTFFATTPVTDEPWSSHIVAIRRTPAGAWSHDVVTTLPLSEIADGRLAVAGPDAGAVAGWSEYYSLPLHTFRRVDGAWVTEEIATVYPSDRIALQVSGDSTKVLAGGYSLRSWERNEDGVFAETAHGDIGMSGVVGGGAGGCSLTGVASTSASNAGLAMMALAAVGLVITRRRVIRSR